MSVHAAMQPGSFRSVCLPNGYSGKWKYGAAEHNITRLVEEIEEVLYGFHALDSDLCTVHAN